MQLCDISNKKQLLVHSPKDLRLYIATTLAQKVEHSAWHIKVLEDSS